MSRRRRLVPSPRIWIPAAAGFGIVLLLILAIAVVGRAVNQPRPAAETGASSAAATSDTPLGTIPAAPPAGLGVSPQQPAAPQAPRFTAKPIEPSYTVASGDTLSSIAARFNTNADALRSINNLPDTRLSVGQRLVLP
jgi:LysM repeat protein